MLIVGPMLTSSPKGLHLSAPMCALKGMPALSGAVSTIQNPAMLPTGVVERSGVDAQCHW